VRRIARSMVDDCTSSTTQYIHQIPLNVVNRRYRSCYDINGCFYGSACTVWLINCVHEDDLCTISPRWLIHDAMSISTNSSRRVVDCSLHEYRPFDSSRSLRIYMVNTSNDLSTLYATMRRWVLLSDQRLSQICR